MAAAQLDWRCAGLWLVCAVCAGATAGLAGGLLSVSLPGLSWAPVAGAGHLLLLIVVPWGVAKWLERHFVAATATTLLCAMAAMHLVPVLAGSRAPTVLVMTAVAIVLGLRTLRLHARRSRLANPTTVAARTHACTRPTWPARKIGRSSAVGGLALCAGLATGVLARFELMSLCGPTAGATSIATWMLWMAVVLCVGVFVDRGHPVKILVLLYVARAAILAALSTQDAAAFAMPAAQALLAIDCLTLPALLRLSGMHCTGTGTASPGIAHHAGMAIGTALATTPYFFGDAFAMLSLAGSATSLVCATCLGMWRWPRFTSAALANGGAFRTGARRTAVCSRARTG